VKDESKKLLVFVEVKSRRNRKFGEPEDSITQRKIDQICKSAEGFLLKNGEFVDYTKRFDVIAIMLEGKSEAIKHYENAF
jgi:putative endonuclease